MKEVIEPIAEVIPRLFKKASQPPKTIKTYFTVLKPDKEERNHSIVFDNLSPVVNGNSVAKRSAEDDDDIICVFDSKTPTVTVIAEPIPDSSSQSGSKPAAKRRLSERLVQNMEVVDCEVIAEEDKSPSVHHSVVVTEMQIETRASKRAKLNQTSQS